MKRCSKKIFADWHEQGFFRERSISQDVCAFFSKRRAQKDKREGNFRLFPSLLNPSPLNDLGRCPKNPLLRIDYLNRNTPYFCTIFIMLTLNRNTRGRRRKQFKTSKHRRREYNRGLRYERDGQQATRRRVAVLHRTAPATEEHVARITTKNLSSNSTRGRRRKQFKEKQFFRRGAYCFVRNPRKNCFDAEMRRVYALGTFRRGRNCACL